MHLSPFSALVRVVLSITFIVLVSLHFGLYARVFLGEHGTDMFRQSQMAALSPADINYEETLSTLRYADR